MSNVVREADGRFITPPRSPGRPRGPTESELIREALQPKKAAVLAKLAELAALGEPRAMELFLRYFSPGARPEDERFVVPGLAQATTMEDKAGAIVAAVSNGQVSASAGERALALLEKYVRVVLVDDHERRIQAIEQGRSQVAKHKALPAPAAAPALAAAPAVPDNVDDLV